MRPTLDNRPAQTTRKAIVDIGSTFVTRIVLVPITVASSIVVARTLGPADKGVYSTALVVGQVFMLMGALGLAKASTFLLARGGDTRRVRETATAMTFLNGLALTSALLAFILLAAPSLLPEVPQSVLLLTLPIPMLTLLRATWEGYLRAEHRNQTLNLISLCFSVGFLAAVVVAVLVHVDVSVVAALRTGAVFVAAAVALAFCLRRGTGLRMRPDKAVAGRLLVLGLPYAAVSLAQNLNLDADVLIIQAYLSNEEVGWYTVSAAVAEMLLYLPMAVGFILFPRTAGADAVAAGREVAVMQRWTVTLTVLAGVVLAVIAGPLVTLMYGAAFAQATEPLRILIPGIVATVWLQVLGSYMMGRGHVWAIAAASGVGAALNITLNIILVPAMGITGAALASAVSYTVAGGLALAFYCRHTGVPARSTFIVSRGEVLTAWRYVRTALPRVRDG